MIKAGIVGATGYTGSELLRILAAHPEIIIHVVTSRSEQGKPVTDLFPGLRGFLDHQFCNPETAKLDACDVVFFATPTGTAMMQAPSLLDAGVRIIDLSADFRLKDASIWSKWYGQPHIAEGLLEQAVYGLPELNRQQITGARLVANPGCYPTAIILALIPLLETGCIDTQTIIADAKSGISGAGRKIAMNLLYAEASDSLKAYGIAGHRHLPEICQVLNTIIDGSVSMTFVPHLVPMVRGIHATVYVHLTKEIDLQKQYEERYRGEYFIDVLPAGSHPDTRSVRASNFCRLALHKPDQGNAGIVLSVIDNLVKGAAGQAIQNMNIMFGLDERSGLGQPALTP